MNKKRYDGNNVLITSWICGPLAVNCYLLGSLEEKEVLLIDPGGCEEEIVNYLDQTGLVPKLIIATHGHLDHIMSIPKLIKKWNVNVACHPEEITYFMNPDPLMKNFLGSEYVPFKPNLCLEDGDKIHIGSHTLEVIHTPGHTAGHCTFLELNSEIAFLADIDLTNFVFYAGIDSNLIDFEESIDKLQKVNIKKAITGHRGLIEGKKLILQELDNYKSIIQKRDERILSYLSANNPKTILDFKGKNLIYKYYSQFKEYEIIAEMIMIQKHFDKFLVDNKIQEKEQGYILN